MRRLLLLTLLCPASHTYGLAPLPTQFVLDSWGTKSGLPEEMIYSVTQTPDGYLWPEMDGFEASRTIRSRLGHEPVIIAMTANALPGDRERCLDAGMNDYLAKPFQRSDLVQLLDRYLPAVEPAGQRLEPLPK